MNIKQMYENGVAISEIARRTGRDRKTIRKWIQSDGPPKKVRRMRCPMGYPYLSNCG
ncbi:helix-turn-helix domain-containing protein [Desulfolucanica intricata]|uniref:helix-turn-helix domain-containing protein n=1 Tax=Desulfolucanica intricata TaxID=1285191 RepID=UPI000ACD1D98